MKTESATTERAVAVGNLVSIHYLLQWLSTQFSHSPPPIGLGLRPMILSKMIHVEQTVGDS